MDSNFIIMHESTWPWCTFVTVVHLKHPEITVMSQINWSNCLTICSFDRRSVCLSARGSIIAPHESDVTDGRTDFDLYSSYLITVISWA